MQYRKYNKVTTVNRQGNRLPQKPTAHQAGRPHDNFIIVTSLVTKKNRDVEDKTPAAQTERVKRLSEAKYFF